MPKQPTRRRCRPFTDRVAPDAAVLHTRTAGNACYVTEVLAALGDVVPARVADAVTVLRPYQFRRRPSPARSLKACPCGG